MLKWLLVADDELRLPGQLHACVRRQSRPEQPPRCPASEAGEDADDYDDQVPDEDNLDTNIEAKRDKMISDLLSKEDLGII